MIKNDLKDKKEKGKDLLNGSFISFSFFEYLVTIRD